MRSVKYFRKFLPSKSRNFVVKSTAISDGQFWEGRKTLMKKVYASVPLVLQIVCKRFAISWST